MYITLYDLENIENENIESFKKSYENDLTPDIHSKIEKSYTQK